MKPKPAVYLLGIGSVLADYISSELILDHPEAYETNPHYNPWMELVAVEGGVAGIQTLGKLMGVPENVRIGVSAIVPTVPLLLAANNTWLHMIVHAKEVPWDDIVFLYPE